MPILSVHITPGLQKQLKQKSKEMGGLKISDTVRILLQNALDVMGQSNTMQDYKIQKQLLQYSITSYYMIQSHLINSFEEGEQLNDTAHKKANKIMERVKKNDIAE